MGSSLDGVGITFSDGTIQTTAAFSTGKEADVQTFTSTGIWTKPNRGQTMAKIQLWGGGGGGSKNPEVNSGGGGGAYNEIIVPLSYLDATVTVVVGAGGAGATTAGGAYTGWTLTTDGDGGDGGKSYVPFKQSYNGMTKITAYGGGGGSGYWSTYGGDAGTVGGGGGSIISTGGKMSGGNNVEIASFASWYDVVTTAADSMAYGYGVAVDIRYSKIQYRYGSVGGGTGGLYSTNTEGPVVNRAGNSDWGGGGGGSAGGTSIYGGLTKPLGRGGDSIWGGGGGGGAFRQDAGPAGISIHAGNGGSNSVGIQPAGGGAGGIAGANGWAGGDGMVIITSW